MLPWTDWKSVLQEMENRMLRSTSLTVAALLGLACAASSANAQQKKPNILIIWGDDIGSWNISAFNRGMMGYQTPNIDRIAREGMMFTDYYGQQSCTAGRAAFMFGQSPFRTGLTKVGLPGAEEGIGDMDPTMAELLRNQGYATGQFGKNHFGDKDKHLPTNHGFDEFFGCLYHLNASEEPEHEDYPKVAGFKERFGPRGVIRSFADGRVEDTGPLTRKRMETFDDETMTTALDFIDRQHKASKPFFCWWNGTRMHFRTHVKKELRGISGQDEYADGMVEHDMHVGQLLKKIDDLGIADNTIVMYSTDNGVHFNTWPDAGITPFRSEKNTNWEGAFRVSCHVRWPGKIKAGSVSNDIMAHEDWVPTLLAAAGDPNVTQKLLKGMKVGSKTYKSHIDGHNFLPYLTGKEKKGPRNDFFYISDDAELMALRLGDWKVVFMEQRAHQFDVWRDPMVALRAPKIFHLRRDPFERADIDSNVYNEWWEEHAPYIYLAQARMAKAVATLAEFPPRQKPASFNMDKILENLEKNNTSP